MLPPLVQLKLLQLPLRLLLLPIVLRDTLDGRPRLVAVGTSWVHIREPQGL
jgi:hypothetical protein